IRRALPLSFPTRRSSDLPCSPTSSRRRPPMADAGLATVEGRPRVGTALLRLLRQTFVRLGVLPLLLVILLVGFGTWEPRFLSRQNIFNVARQATYLTVVSMGQMIALLTGGFDLSVGVILAMTSVVLAKV